MSGQAVAGTAFEAIRQCRYAHDVRARQAVWYEGSVDSRDRRGQRPLRATVSGSFRRALPGVQDAVRELVELRVKVLSPADPRAVAQVDGFLFVASDLVRTIKPVQSRHLAAIAASDFLWLVAPAGYVGQSASMEIGYATAVGTPVYASEAPKDVTLRHYVEVVADIVTATRTATPRSSADVYTSVLLDPVSTVEAGHSDLELIAGELTGPSTTDRAMAAAARRLYDEIILPLA
jgi:hypothetical protein